MNIEATISWPECLGTAFDSDDEAARDWIIRSSKRLASFEGYGLVLARPDRYMTIATVAMSAHGWRRQPTTKTPKTKGNWHRGEGRLDILIPPDPGRRNSSPDRWPDISTATLVWVVSPVSPSMLALAGGVAALAPTAKVVACPEYPLIITGKVLPIRARGEVVE